MNPWDDLKQSVWAVYEPYLKRALAFLNRLIEGRG